MQSHGGGRGMRRAWVKRVIVVLVLLNVIPFFLFLMHTSEKGEKLPGRKSLGSGFRQGIGKPWPRLRSFTSWSPNPNLDQGSCEAFFGNGFTEAFTLLDSEPRSKGWSRIGKEEALIQGEVARRSRNLKQVEASEKQGLRIQRRMIQSSQLSPQRSGLFQCFYSETLQTSICEGTQMIMYPKKIKMSKGGEPLDSVMGRNEEEELPYFTSGAFQIMVPERDERRALFNKTMLEKLIPEQSIAEHTMHHLFEQTRTIPLDEVTCAQVLFIF